MAQPVRSYARPPGELRPGALAAPTRMAMQMAAALALAFLIGFTLFPAHWSWMVLSAFIVCSGAVGRGDAAYKGILRIAGAVAGTAIAACIAHVHFSNSVAFAATVFGVLFLGIWLRALNYAYWAACATLIFGLLHGAQDTNVGMLFVTRLPCIGIGALCAVAATWFVYPIRTEDVVRRRVADALAALREALAGHPSDEETRFQLEVLAHHSAELERVAAPVRLHRRFVPNRRGDEHPASWIDRTHALLLCVRTPGFDRKFVGEEMRRLGASLRAPRRATGADQVDSPPVARTMPRAGKGNDF